MQRTKQVRRAAGTVACIELLSIIINYALLPVMRQMPEFTDGSAAAELYEIALYLLIFGTPVLIGMKLTGMEGRDLLGRGKPPARVYLMTIGLTAGWSYAANWLAVLMEYGLNCIGLTEPGDAYILPTSAAALALQFLSVAIIPPIVEEMGYRGLYLNLTVRSMGTGGAIVLTALVFWMAHYSIEILPLAFGFGLLGGYLRRRYGSLLPSMLGHFVVNGVYVLVNYCYERFGSGIGLAISGAVNLAELALAAVGVALFLASGGLRDVRAMLGEETDLTAGQLARTAIFNIPAIALLLSAVYFTARGLAVY